MKQDRDDAQAKTRQQAVLLAQVRSGHYKGLSYYDNIIDPTKSDACRRCEMEETGDTEHWFAKCPLSAAGRQRIFESHDIDMMELALSPAKSIELTERTLVKRAPMQG